MRLTLINQFYRPDISPTAQLSASLAEHRAAVGDEVTVITSGGRYANAKSSGAGATDDSRVTSDFKNPHVIRVWTPGLGKSSILKRIADYLAFYLGAVWHMLRLPAQDVIISLTTPPYIAWAAVLHRMIHRRTRIVLWNMDCYPDVAERAGILRKGGALSRLLRLANRALFRQIDHLVCLDTAMVDLLCTQYARDATHPPVTIIPNWEDAALFPAGARARAPRWAEADALDLNGNFVVLYLGNTGVGHAFETVLDAADRLRNEPVRFLFVGGGSRMAQIRQAKLDRRLDNVILHDYIPKEQTPSLMSAAGCALITLRDEALGVMSPSKLHSNLAMGLAVLYVGPRGSNVDDAIRKFDCGISLRHGDVKGMIDFIRWLASDTAARQTMQQRAREAFETAYCDARAFVAFDRLLSETHAPR
jgi:glycosyltransferase involved in cell wall biosynthesis